MMERNENFRNLDVTFRNVPLDFNMTPIYR